MVIVSCTEDEERDCCGYVHLYINFTTCDCVQKTRFSIVQFKANETRQICAHVFTLRELTHSHVNYEQWRKTDMLDHVKMQNGDSPIHTSPCRGIVFLA